MNIIKIIAPGLLVAMALTATAAQAQSTDQWRGGKNKSPVDTRTYTLSRSCLPGAAVNVTPYIVDHIHSGTLRLRVDGSSQAEVYVDGVYAGHSADFDGASRRASLKTGVHRIEVRADGFTPLQFSTRIERSRTTTHIVTLPPAFHGGRE
jgi:hypothetical protein